MPEWIWIYSFGTYLQVQARSRQSRVTRRIQPSPGGSREETP